jgi:predicted nucleic acid-binding protein
LEVAVSGQATVIVTGDRDLLDLHLYRGIAIMTPRGFMNRP